MRIKEEFAISRRSEVKKYKPKYFIISEGSNSEPLYFEGLQSSVISENITIINILRDYASACNSHPSFIVKMVKEFILNVKADEISVLELKNKIANCIYEYKYDIDIKSIYKELLFLYKSDDFKLKKENLGNLFLHLFKDDVYKDLSINFPLYLQMQDITYSEVTDKLNIVIDRDEQNFKENQYDQVVKFCRSNNVNLYVSNPTFEFWLMLHFPEVEAEDRLKMFENRYVNKSKRYLEKRLHDICGYEKAKLNFKDFEPFIKEAIKREKNYEENVEKLKNELGSNIGILINDMLKNNKKPQ